MEFFGSEGGEMMDGTDKESADIVIQLCAEHPDAMAENPDMVKFMAQTFVAFRCV